MKSSTRCRRPKSSSNNGGGTTTPRDRTLLWAIALRPPKRSSRWTKGRSCTHIHSGPIKGGQSVLGQSYQFPEGVPALYAYNIVIKPGQKTNWHKHTVPLYAYILSGSLTVDYGSKGSRVFEKGMSYIEAIDFRHRGPSSPYSR